MIGLSPESANRVRQLIGRSKGAGASLLSTGKGYGRTPVLVRCTSATAAGASGVGAQCYPGIIVDPLADQTVQPELGTVWLTILDDGGAAGVPAANRVYECLLAGSVAVGTDTRPRAFGVQDHTDADPDASTTVRGYVSTTTQSFAGAKTFTGAVYGYGGLSVTGGLAVDAANISGTASVGGTATFFGATSMAAGATVAGGLTADAETVTGALSVGGLGTFSAGVVVTGGVTANFPGIGGDAVTATARISGVDKGAVSLSPQDQSGPSTGGGYFGSAVRITTLGMVGAVLQICSQGAPGDPGSRAYFVIDGSGSFGVGGGPVVYAPGGFSQDGVNLIGKTTSASDLTTGILDGGTW